MKKQYYFRTAIFLLIFNSESFSQEPQGTPAPEPPPTAAAPARPEFPQGLGPAAAGRYAPRFMKGARIANDGFPIRDEVFEFTVEELKKLDDVNVVREALKREQRRLTKMFFQDHPAFKKYSASSLKVLIKTSTDAVDKSLDDKTTIAELSYFNFDSFRGHLVRFSGWLVGSRHTKIYNPSGEASLIGWFIPRTPFDYIALLSLILNIFLAAYILIK